ncbi:MAG: flagellar basal body rod protein FlgB [Nitrospirae bacterium]|nr:flagellar basal body rod protein FlgB [Nitrospirota bacterium]MBI3351832.1 flagellar basal body rod protein FlgB [Nitrospirota bacterium]
MNIFGETINLLEKALDIRGERAQVINSNIANQDTPGFKGNEIDFKETLKKLSGPSEALTLIHSHPYHFGVVSPGQSIEPSPLSAPSVRLDGNNINSENEMAKLAENTLSYQASVQIISKEFNMIRSAIKEGR